MKKVFSLTLLLAASCVLTSCGDDDEPGNEKLSQTSYLLHHDTTRSIEGKNVSNLAWRSDNEFVATVKNGEITGQLVGSTTIRAKDLSIKAEVLPRYHIYEEPCLDWGASKASIKSKYGSPYTEDATGLVYKTANTNAPIMSFVFTNGRLSTCGVVCKISTASQLVDFLLERYVPIQVNANKYTASLVHCYGKINNPQVDFGVGMQYSSSLGGILVAYTPANSKSRSLDDADFSKSFDALENVIK